ncbi:hypothetical protein Tco_1187556 [Tanacetum coccineum]
MWTPIDYAYTGGAKEWWLSNENYKLTAWGMLVGIFFCKYHPLSRDGKNSRINNNDRYMPSYFEFMTWIDLKSKDHESIDRITKSAIGHFWIYGWGIDEPMDDIE